MKTIRPKTTNKERKCNDLLGEDRRNARRHYYSTTKPSDYAKKIFNRPAYSCKRKEKNNEEESQ